MTLSRRRTRGALALALLAGSLTAFSAPAGAEGSPRSFPTAPAAGAPGAAGASLGAVFVPIVPCRVLDTRGTGVLGASASVTITMVGGSCAVPAAATSVEASISAVTPAGNGFARVWPTGSTPSTGTVLNYSKGKGTTNTGAVAISATGQLTLKNFSGPAHYVIDIQGYYAPQADIPVGTIGSTYVPLRPCRVLDTRGGSPLAAGVSRNVPVATTPGCAVPADATGVAASVSAVTPAGEGYARIWPAGAGAPNATFLNYAKAQATTNTGAIALGTSASLTLRNFGGPAHYVVDIQGYFVKPVDLASGIAYTEFHAFTPCRFFDSREGPDALPFGPGDFIGGPLAENGTGCPIPEGSTAVVLSVSAVAPTAAGYTRVYPAAGGPPNATTVNYAAGQSTTNTGATSVDADYLIELTNYSGTTDYTLEAQGAWTPVFT